MSGFAALEVLVGHLRISRAPSVPPRELLKERVVFLLGLEDKFSCIRAFPAGQLPSCSIPLVTLGDCFGQNVVEVELGNPTVPIRSVVEFDALPKSEGITTSSRRKVLDRP